MNGLPENFVKSAEGSSKRSPINRPAPFSLDEFSTESIEQGSLAYVQHVENSHRLPDDEKPQAGTGSNEHQQPTVINVPEPVIRAKKPGQPRQSSPTSKQPVPTVSSDNKANIRLEIDAVIRKDMIKLKHKVGITHGVEVSYAAYFMFLHERCRAESSTADFLADLAQFTEQRKRV